MGTRISTSSRDQLTQDKGQNPAMLVVVHFDGGVDPQKYGHALARAVWAMNHERGVLLGQNAVFQSLDIKRFGTGQA